jgi:hypothetical protein
MPTIPPLTDLYIDETYGRLVQTNDTRTEFADGLGNAITFGTISTGSFATTGSNLFIGDQQITGSLSLTGSVTAYSFEGIIDGGTF